MPEDQPGDRPPFGVEKVGDEKRAASIRSALHELHNAEKPISPDNPFASTERAVSRLTKAVWAVAALLALHAILAVLNFFQTQSMLATAVPAGATFPGTGSTTISDEPFPVSRSRFESEAEFNGFHEWPLDRQIKAASVIALVKYEKDGDRHKAVFSEFLKKDPGVKFYYNVGDEWERGGWIAREGVKHGDGQIVFFTGNPASMKFSCSFHGTRILSFGDMPLETLRERAKGTANPGATNRNDQ